VTFKGGFNDSLKFEIDKKSSDTLVPIQSLIVLSKDNDTVPKAYPVEVINKYKLFEPPSNRDVEKCADIVIEQRNIENVRKQKDPLSSSSSPNYAYKCVKLITLKACGKVIVKDFKVERDYESSFKQQNNISKKDIIFNFAQFKNQNKYYFTIAIADYLIGYELVHKDKRSQSASTVTSSIFLFWQQFLISCP